MFCYVDPVLRAVTCPLATQVVDASTCDILSNPQAFDGKTVRIKGAVIAGFGEFTIKASGCNPVAGAVVLWSLSSH
jgi:hypothetical protein